MYTLQDNARRNLDWLEEITSLQSVLAQAKMPSSPKYSNWPSIFWRPSI